MIRKAASKNSSDAPATASSAGGGVRVSKAASSEKPAASGKKPAAKKKRPVPPTLQFERAAGYPVARVLGVDEVGRGCLAGPVVAGAVLLPLEWDLPRAKLFRKFPELALVTDSKAVKREDRERLAPWIREHVAAWGIGSASVEEIDRINIFHASHLAMERAVQDLIARFGPVPTAAVLTPPEPEAARTTTIESEVIVAAEESSAGIVFSEFGASADSGAIEPALIAESLSECARFAHVLVDGNIVPRAFRGNATAIVKGDLRCLSIACASILAKVFRDDWMKRLALEHPGFGFEIHKGYATPMHRDAIDRLGPTEMHRKSFSPVRIAFGERIEIESMQLDLLAADLAEDVAADLETDGEASIGDDEAQA